MTDTRAPKHWFYREDGVVRSASWDVADPTPLLLETAYGKSWRGEALTEAEAEALANAKAEPPSGNLNSDHLLGWTARHHPALLAKLDALAEELASVGLWEPLAWQMLRSYCGAAESVTWNESGLFREETATLEALGASPAEIAASQARWAAEEADAEAWPDSPEGKAAIAAMVPDGGPEGWSQTPPPEGHPMRSPEAAAQAQAASAAFYARRRAERGES